MLLANGPLNDRLIWIQILHAPALGSLFQEECGSHAAYGIHTMLWIPSENAEMLVTHVPIHYTQKMGFWMKKWHSLAVTICNEYAQRVMHKVYTACSENLRIQIDSQARIVNLKMCVLPNSQRVGLPAKFLQNFPVSRIFFGRKRFSKEILLQI